MKPNKLTACLAALAVTLSGTALVFAIARPAPPQVQAYDDINGTDHCVPLEETTYWYPTETNPESTEVEEENGTAIYVFNYGSALFARYVEKENAPDAITVEVPSEIAGCPVRYINNYAFGYKKKVKEVILPDGIIGIGDKAFYESPLLECVRIPASLETLGSSAFESPNLTNIFYGGTAEQWQKLQPYRYSNITVHCIDTYIPAKIMGDLNADKQSNASDAAMILIASAENGAGKEISLNEWQKEDADVNSDGMLNASDAAIVLQYAAATGSGQNVTLQDFIQ